MDTGRNVETMSITLCSFGEHCDVPTIVDAKNGHRHVNSPDESDAVRPLVA